MNAEKAKIVIERIKSGMSLMKATEFNDPCSYPTFLGWCSVDKNLADEYARAREVRADRIFDELENISNQEPQLTQEGKVDSGWVQMQRLKIDTYKWKLGKMSPKKYGDKIDLTSGGDKLNININVE